MGSLTTAVLVYSHFHLLFVGLIERVTCSPFPNCVYVDDFYVGETLDDFFTLLTLTLPLL